VDDKNTTNYKKTNDLDKSPSKKSGAKRLLPVTNEIDENATIDLEINSEIFDDEKYNDSAEDFVPYGSTSLGYSKSRTIDGSSILPKERFKWARRQFKRAKRAKNIISIDQAARYNPSPEHGLSKEQVEGRVNNGLINVTKKKNSKTIGNIFLTNMVTPINIIAIAVAVAMLSVGQAGFSQMLFLLILGVNMFIGIFQEIRAKITVEKLSIVTAPTATVMRNGEKIVIPVSEVVLDDIMFVEAGKQICADAILVKGEVEANESLLTGESVPIKKTIGSDIYSGSFVTAGNCYARVNKVGAANYIETLASHVKKYKKPKSELYNSIMLIIKIVIPIAILIAIATTVSFYFTVIRDFNFEALPTTDWPLGTTPADLWAANVQQTAGAVIGMLPIGMFLLTSAALMVSVIRLAKRRTLVKDFYCIEMLARVNVLCLDKTGTITDGTMNVTDVVEIKGAVQVEHSFNEIIGSMLTATGDNNQTAMALAGRFGYSHALTPVSVIPFSSVRKLAAVSFKDAGTYIYGAPEFVLKDMGVRIDKLVTDYAKKGLRVMVLAHSPAYINGDKLPAIRRPLCLIAIEDNIRADAYDTVKWFKENGVAVKVISGDNPITVSEVAMRVGVENADLYISLDGLSENEVIESATKYTVFGRVSPEQKRLLIKTLKDKGKTVAMTGDGVNDILAMRESDCSIAIASGSEAARNVAHLVLQDSNFSSMPQVVLEGRRVINNIQQTSALYIMKTIMTLLLAAISLIMREPYPYQTNHLLLLEMIIIALASFALAMQPNTKLITGKFINNVMGRSAPGGITLAASMMAIYSYRTFLMGADNNGGAIYTTMLVMGVTLTGFIVLVKLCEPPNMFRIVLLLVTGLLIGIGIFALPMIPTIGPDLFGITPGVLRTQDVLYLIVTILGSYFFMSILIRIMRSLKILHY